MSPGSRSRRRRGYRGWLEQLGIGLLFLVAWEAAVRIFEIPPFLIPSPIAVAESLWLGFTSGIFVSNATYTLTATLLGFVLGSLIGLILGVLISNIEVLDRLLYPYIVAFQTVPKVAIAPLAVVYLGYGLSSKSFIAFLVSFFPLVINTTLGLKSVDPDLLDLLKSLKASQRTVLLKVRVFTALPYFIEGTKIAVTLAIIGAVVGEFQAGNEGLGYLIAGALTQFNMVLSFSALLVLTVIGVILFKLVDVVGVALTPWMQR